MIHILLEGYDIRAKWLYRELRHYIKPSHKVVVIAFSFRDGKVKNLADWEALYGDGSSIRRSIVRSFSAYGVKSEQISFVNYFSDTKEKAKQTVENADIVYFPSGLPDRMMARIDEFELREALTSHKGIMMGYSAGALVQLAEYHLSPDHDYPTFCYGEGLACIDDFYVEVHYEETDIQRASIQKVLAERGKTVYAMSLMKGAVLLDENGVRLLGEVYVFHRTDEDLG
jgi:hypothetical protein